MTLKSEMSENYRITSIGSRDISFILHNAKVERLTEAAYLTGSQNNRAVDKDWSHGSQSDTHDICK